MLKISQTTYEIIFHLEIIIHFDTNLLKFTRDYLFNSEKGESRSVLSVTNGIYIRKGSKKYKQYSEFYGNCRLFTRAAPPCDY
jgi:hypothetical protein